MQSLDSKLLKDCVNNACTEVIKMRKSEGKVLQADFKKRLNSLSEVLSKIEKRLPEELDNRSEKYKNKIIELINNNSIDESRIAMETAILAEKADVTEEVVRLKSHFDQFHGMISSKIAKYISNKDKFISLNAQVNAANIGTHNIRKYHNINCLIINSSELRHEMRQREGNLITLAAKLKETVSADHITVTQGRSGAFLLNNGDLPINCPGFAVDIVDKIGAGDTFLSIISLILLIKHNRY